MPYNPTVKGNNSYSHGFTTFYGYRKAAYHPDGYSSAEMNMVSDNFPCLAVRNKRCAFEEVSIPGIAVDIVKDDNGVVLFTRDGFVYTSDGAYSGMGTVDNVIKFGRNYVAVPSFAVLSHEDDSYNITCTGTVEMANIAGASSVFSTTPAETSGESAIFELEVLDGSIWFDDIYSENDVVVVEYWYTSGNSSSLAQGNGTILAVSGEVMQLSVPATAGFPTAANTAVRIILHKQPKIDFACEHNNRIWGCRYGEAYNGYFVNEIYASALGSYDNFTDFSGDSMDSYAVSLGCAGEFTGCCSVGDYIIFFKEDAIIYVYGDTPENFSVDVVANYGVQKGSEKSICMVNGYVYYKSQNGIMRLAPGSMPQRIDADLGVDNYKNAIAGTNGDKYYIQMQDKSGSSHMFVYDINRGLWHEEDSIQKLFAMIQVDNNVLAVKCDLDAYSARLDEIESYLNVPAPDSADYANNTLYLAAVAVWIALRAAALAISNLGIFTNDRVVALMQYTYIHRPFIPTQLIYLDSERICDDEVMILRNVTPLAVTGETIQEADIDEYWAEYDSTAVDTTLTTETEIEWSWTSGEIGVTEPTMLTARRIAVTALRDADSELKLSVSYDGEEEYTVIWQDFQDKRCCKTVTAERHTDRCKSYKLRIDGKGYVNIFGTTDFITEAGD